MSAQAAHYSPETRTFCPGLVIDRETGRELCAFLHAPSSDLDLMLPLPFEVEGGPYLITDFAYDHAAANGDGAPAALCEPRTGDWVHDLHYRKRPVEWWTVYVMTEADMRRRYYREPSDY